MATGRDTENLIEYRPRRFLFARLKAWRDIDFHLAVRCHRSTHRLRSKFINLSTDERGRRCAPVLVVEPSTAIEEHRGVADDEEDRIACAEQGRPLPDFTSVEVYGKKAERIATECSK